jgi:TolB-like protein
VAGVALFPVTLLVAWFVEHPWHRYTSSRLAIDIVLIVGIGISAFAWVKNNIPQVIHTRTSIVVMPFDYSDQDPQGEFISRALALQINSLLMKSRSIDVFRYETANSPLLKGLDVLGIIEALDVEHVLSGVISSAGASMNISLSLHDSAGSELWSSELSEDIEDLPAVQERIATQVQNRIGETGKGLAITKVASTECPMPTDPSALNRYFTARHYVQLRSDSAQSNQELRDAVRLYEELIEQYPNFAQAYSGLAWARAYQVTYDPEFRGRRRDVRSQLNPPIARKALELCPGLGEALVLVGNEADHPNRWINEEQNVSLWREMQPDSTEAIEKYTYHLGMVGRMFERIRLAEENYRLNPYSVKAIKHLKGAYQYDYRYEEAIVLEKLAEELGSTADAFVAEEMARAACGDNLECRLSALPADFAPFADQMRAIYTAPESEEQQETSIQTAVDLVNMSNGMVLNWFNGSACNFDHLTPLFFRLWDRYVEIMETGEQRWFWFWPNAWRGNCFRVWEHQDFPRVLEQAGMVEYFRAKAWPDACKPDEEGDGFSCSKAIWEEKRSAAGL